MPFGKRLLRTYNGYTQGFLSSLLNARLWQSQRVNSKSCIRVAEIQSVGQTPTKLELE